ncbi:hypothetical protein SEA_BANQUO_42 [Gordonia phage Banquo]|nr:hypothetical protein SEA_BANQUO_42 [Gordonia phage Banquo]
MTSRSGTNEKGSGWAATHPGPENERSTSYQPEDRTFSVSQNTVSVPVHVIVNALDALSTFVVKSDELLGDLRDAALDAYTDEPVPFVPAEDEPRPLPVGAEMDAAIDAAMDRLAMEVQPAEFGTYRDGDGDLWRHTPDGWQPIETSDGVSVTHLTIESGWSPEVAACGPFELVEDEPASYTLSEAAHQLGERGIETGRNRLYRFLNEGIAWTDGDGSPRPAADGYLIVAEPASGSRSAVVRVTPEGVAELARVLGAGQ